jgi:hypothetical protein
MVEGMADETESEIRKDIAALEVLIQHCKERDVKGRRRRPSRT